MSNENSIEEWNYFVSRWQNYKKATNLTESNLTSQLIECCDESLRKDLTRVHRDSLYKLNETDLLGAMIRLAVQEENVLVSRFKLHNLKQDIDEPIRSYTARLRGQANVCKLVVTCPNCQCPEVDFSDEIIRDAITRGIHDDEIRLNLLSDKNQNMTVEEILAYVEAKESGKKSVSRLSDSVNVSAATSRYKSRQRNTQSPKCGYCGRSPGHGTVYKERQRSCPAFKHKCEVCGIVVSL